MLFLYPIDSTKPSSPSMAINPSTLERALHLLQSHPYPTVPNPLSCQKRASVALILRIHPSNPSANTTCKIEKHETSIANFFTQEWVQKGDPEVLFIRRASRHGDRWTGHVAFPGGKRDPEDVSDRAAAERETLEEVGLDLATTVTRGAACYVGGLPQQIVSTNWGNVPFVSSCASSYYTITLGQTR